MACVYNRYIIIWLILLFLVFPVSATTTAELKWSKTVGDTFNYPTNVDTTDNGTVVYVTMSNGSIMSYDLNGNTRWFLQTNGSIKKIEANANGTVAWINIRNESGLIKDNSTLRYYRPDGLRNITDVAVSGDGNYYAFTEKSGARINIQAYSGNLTQNSSFGIANWTNIAFDPNAQWVVTANQSDRNLYLWNLTLYNGWIDFNPTKSIPKNTSQTNLDSFTYRRNLSIENFASTTHLYIKNASNANVSSARVYQINKTTFEYNASSIGRYLYFTSYGNISDNNSVINASYFVNNTLVLGFKPTMKNVTMYYGNTSFNNEFYNSTSLYTDYTTAGSYTFTIPSSVTSVGYVGVGGGGGGGPAPAGVTYHGVGGSAATRTTGTLTIPTGQTTIAVVVGDGGAGGTGSGSGVTGGTSTINGTIAAGGGSGGSYTTPWTTGGNGATGYDSASTFGGIGSQGFAFSSGCVVQNAAGNAGTGYGAGGGGQGGGESNNVCGFGGGAGAKGHVNITYSIINSYLGADPTNIYLGAEQIQTSDNSIAYVTNRSLGGNISAMDVPEMGGWVSVSTDEPKVYHQQVTISGFGTQYSGTANTGTARMIRAADSNAYSIEARDLMADIYQLDGTRKGTYTTGGIVQSVDFAVKNGLWAISGGDDGKIYVFSKDTTSSWYVFYQGDSNSPITSVAISWRGEYFIVGRTDGTVEYYSTGGLTTSTTTNYLINVFVNKGGVPYSNANITITSGTSPDTAIETYTNGQADSVGKFSFIAEDLKYYKININSGEYIFTYQATSTYTTVTINIPTPMVTRPYDYTTSYNDATSIITTTYTDVNMADVNISIIDMSTNQVIHWGNYSSVTYVSDSHTCGLLNKSHEYKVNVQFVRTTGHAYTDTLYVKSSVFGQSSTVVPTQWILFKYAVYSIMLMFVALGIGAASTKWGVIILPALTVLGIIIGFLPFNLYTGGLLVSAFIAMLEVMRRRPD